MKSFPTLVSQTLTRGGESGQIIKWLLYCAMYNRAANIDMCNSKTLTLGVLITHTTVLKGNFMQMSHH